MLAVGIGSDVNFFYANILCLQLEQAVAFIFMLVVGIGSGDEIEVSDEYDKNLREYVKNKNFCAEDIGEKMSYNSFSLKFF